MSELGGKTAVVTGASRGIGQEIAASLAQAGARVFCISTAAGGCDRTLALCRERGGQAEAMVADVGDEAAVEALGKQVLAAAGSVELLVNNAGITRDGLLVRTSAEDFDRVLGVNLRGTFLVCRAFARAMAKARFGRIVNISSVVGLAGNAGQTSYAASKAGIVGFSKSLAAELGGRNVTVNVVAPGFIETDMTAELPAEVKTKALESIPLSRFGQPADVAAAVRFLCGDSASYITGQVLVVDGGMTM